jgi:VanZ family protein
MFKYLKTWVFIWIFLFLILISISPENAYGGDDKLKHFGVSSLFGAASESILHYKTNLKTSERIVLGTALGSLPGLAKELIDSTKAGNQFSGSDLAVDIAGAFLGSVVANFFNNLIQIKIDKTEENKSF